MKEMINNNNLNEKDFMLAVKPIKHPVRFSFIVNMLESQKK